MKIEFLYFDSCPSYIKTLDNLKEVLDEENLNDEDVVKLVKDRNFLGYYKTSAKTGQGVFEAFQAIIKELYNKYKEE